MAESYPDHSPEVVALVGRLRLLMAQTADEPATSRQQHLAAELKAALGTVSHASRDGFLAALASHFPTGEGRHGEERHGEERHAEERHEGTEARRHEGTEARRHEGTEARRHEGGGTQTGTGATGGAVPPPMPGMTSGGGAGGAGAYPVTAVAGAGGPTALGGATSAEGSSRETPGAVAERLAMRGMRLTEKEQRQLIDYLRTRWPNVGDRLNWTDAPPVPKPKPGALPDPNMPALQRFAGDIDAIVSKTWRELVPDSPARGGGVRDLLARPASLQRDEAIAGELKRVTIIVGAMMTAVLNDIAAHLASAHLAKLTPEAIEDHVAAEGSSMFKSVEARCWQRYKTQLAADLTEGRIRAAVQQAVAGLISQYLSSTPPKKASGGSTP